MGRGYPARPTNLEKSAFQALFSFLPPFTYSGCLSATFILLRQAQPE